MSKTTTTKTKRITDVASHPAATWASAPSLATARHLPTASLYRQLCCQVAHFPHLSLFQTHLYRWLCWTCLAAQLLTPQQLAAAGAAAWLTNGRRACCRGQQMGPCLGACPRQPRGLGFFCNQLWPGTYGKQGCTTRVKERISEERNKPTQQTKRPHTSSLSGIQPAGRHSAPWSHRALMSELCWDVLGCDGFR